MAKSQPQCVRIYPWLEGNLGPCLGGLTGTDTRSLEAAVMILEAFSYNRNMDLLTAFGLTVKQMQPEFQHFAFHAIAMVMNWEDRADFWELANLPVTPRIKNAPFCEGEPGGKDRPHAKPVGRF